MQTFKILAIVGPIFFLKNENCCQKHSRVTMPGWLDYLRIAAVWICQNIKMLKRKEGSTIYIALINRVETIRISNAVRG